MDGHRTDEEQIEALKKWWGENGISVVGGIIIGLAAVFGWREWQDYQIAQAEAASDIYQKMIIEIRNEEKGKAMSFANQLLDEYPSTAYAIFSHLLLAKLDVESNELQSAIEHLQWVMDNTDENEYEHLARMRIARLLLAENKPAESLEILNTVDSDIFRASYEELRGDSYVKQGKTEEARNAYNQALTHAGTSRGDQSILEMKIGNLGQLNP